MGETPMLLKMAISLAITGAAGRMGSRLIALANESGEFEVVSALERAGHLLIGKNELGILVTQELTATPQVLIDFSSPESMREWLKVCREKRIAMLIGTTGLKPSDHALIDEAAKEIAVLQAPNMSLGVNVLFRIAGEVAKILGDDYDIEIVEAHHRFKKDAPSGTAIGLADAILQATGKSEKDLSFDRHGESAERRRGEIGMHALRIGDEVGKHTAYFAGLGERLELTHVATNRDTFVRGALRAAKWLAGRAPGRYTIANVLGLS
jgi:4-hydroxy-tetrahydrodipicolinate reductase